RKAKATFDAKHQPITAALEKFEKEQLPSQFAAWEKTRKNAPGAGWLIPDITAMQSQGGATITKQDDGSVLVTGTNPPIEALRLTPIPSRPAGPSTRRSARTTPPHLNSRRQSASPAARC